jgi:hypothetical protein
MPKALVSTFLNLFTEAVESGLLEDPPHFKIEDVAAALDQKVNFGLDYSGPSPAYPLTLKQFPKFMNSQGWEIISGILSVDTAWTGQGVYYFFYEHAFNPESCGITSQVVALQGSLKEVQIWSVERETRIEALKKLQSLLEDPSSLLVEYDQKLGGLDVVPRAVPYHGLR